MEALRTNSAQSSLIDTEESRHSQRTNLFLLHGVARPSRSFVRQTTVFSPTIDLLGRETSCKRNKLVLLLTTSHTWISWYAHVYVCSSQWKESARQMASMTRRFELPSLHILHVRCQFCVIRTVGRNKLPVWVSLHEKSILQRDGQAQAPA